MSTTMPSYARWLGYAGLLPQTAALAVASTGDPGGLFTAQELAFAYATLILSFLGGAWWGLASTADRPPHWLWVASVMPSLLALATCIPWATAGEWPGPSLVALGLMLIGSLAIDRRLVTLGVAPPWWTGLRAPLSIGLGLLTIAMGVLALR